MEANTYLELYRERKEQSLGDGAHVKHSHQGVGCENQFVQMLQQSNESVTEKEDDENLLL